MAGRDRYKLVYHYKKGGKKIFELSYEDGNCRKAFTLTEIDMFTTNFSNEEELEKALNLVFSGYEDGYFSIEYNSKGTLTSMELAFSDMFFIRELAGKNLRESKVSKTDINIYMRWMLNKLEKDAEFLKYMYTHRYINEYFKDAFSNYLMLKNSDEKDAQSSLWQAEVKLRKEFMRYKTVRGLEMGRKNFELEKQNMYVSYNHNGLTLAERARLEYELNHPKQEKKIKSKKNDLIEGQLPLFDSEIYTENKGKRTRK